ncbi:MAG TPA: ATP-dependent DNA helicase DinG, partial [Methylophaga sp.]|nr:ATP-dependent DNA helicase DinG [Methylophaga sp.]
MFDEIFICINKLMPDFKARPQQVEMSRFIHQRLQQSQNRMAVVEAPTGVGKTLAYLSGAIETALNSKKLLVISTATVNLQQQLIQKDLPQFSAALPQPIRFMQIKGRRRYVCPSKLAQLATTPEQQDLTLDVDQKYQQVLRQTQAKNLFQDWDEHRWDGDRDSRTDAIDPALWHEVST